MLAPWPFPHSPPIATSELLVPFFSADQVGANLIFHREGTCIALSTCVTVMPLQGWSQLWPCPFCDIRVGSCMVMCHFPYSILNFASLKTYSEQDNIFYHMSSDVPFSFLCYHPDIQILTKSNYIKWGFFYS